MSTFVERNFKVKGNIDCVLNSLSGFEIDTLEGIEVQLWHHGPMEAIFLGKGNTNSSGEYVIDIVIDSPVDYIEDGQIKYVFVKVYYKGQLLETPVYDEDAQLYFDQLSPQPSVTYKSAVNNFIKQLKEDNNWAYLDRLWIFATEYQQNARISLKYPSSTAITEVNSITWTAGQGYTGNGTNMYLNTNYNQSTNAVNYSRDNASVGVYNRTNINRTDCLVGINAFTSQGTCICALGNQFYTHLNCNGTQNGGYLYDNTGLLSVKRTLSSSYLAYKNGVGVFFGSAFSSALVSQNYFVMASNTGGSPAEYSTKQLALAFIGGGQIDPATLYAAVKKLKDALGF